MGSDAPDTSRTHRSKRRSTHAARWWLVGTHWLDIVGHSTESHGAHFRSLRTRSDKRPLLSLAQYLLLCSSISLGSAALYIRWLGRIVVGSFSASYAGSSCDLAGQFGYAPVG